MKYPRTLRQGEMVRVYRNLHTGKLSVIGLNENGYKTVIAHVDNIFLVNPTFLVSQSGREKVLREKVKNVHAFVVGTLGYYNTPDRLDLYKTFITYNPYKYNSFVRVADEKPVDKLHYAFINANGKIATDFNMDLTN